MLLVGQEVWVPRCMHTEGKIIKCETSKTAHQMKQQIIFKTVHSDSLSFSDTVNCNEGDLMKKLHKHEYIQINTKFMQATIFAFPGNEKLLLLWR